MATALLPGLCALLLLGALGGAGGAAAADESFEEEVLDILKERGDISPEDYERLKEKAAEDASDDWHFQWKNGFQLQQGDGKEFKLEFGGRIQNDWTYYDPDSNLEKALGGDGFGTKFRRARLFFEGTVYEFAYFKAQYDFAESSTDSDGDGPFNDGGIKDMYMGLKGLPGGTAVQIGHQKEPFSLQQMTSSKYLTFIERALPDALVPGRNTGLQIKGTAFDANLAWRVGAFEEANDFGAGFNDDQQQNVTVTIGGTPVYEDDGARVVYLGASYSHQFRNDDNLLRYRARPENSFAPRLIDTGSMNADDADLFNASAAVVMNAFSAQSEWTGSKVDLRTGSNPFFWGAYGEVSYFLTGEHRNFKHGGNSFARVSPKRNFDPRTGDWGGWEIAARYSYLDLSDEGVKGGKLGDVTGALNWYLFPNFRVMFDYIFSQEWDRAGVPTGDAHSGLARFQIDF